MWVERRQLSSRERTAVNLARISRGLHIDWARFVDLRGLLRSIGIVAKRASCDHQNRRGTVRFKGSSARLHTY